jgi:hypothetical protein
MLAMKALCRIVSIIGLISALMTSAVPVASVSTSSQQGPTKGFRCNFAKVYHLKPGAQLPVRSGPGLQFPKIDHLVDGTVVYTCDEQGEWLKVSYGDKTTPCGSIVSDGIDAQKVSACKSGWVERKYVNVISG